MGIETVGKLKVLTFGTGDILVSNTNDSREDKVRKCRCCDKSVRKY